MRVRPLKNNPISLTNRGQLSLFTLGCGSAFARTLGQNNFIVIKGQTHLMIDCGTKAPGRLRSIGLDVTDVRNFLITHSHADHIGGLEEVMLTGRYVAGQKPVAYIEPRYQRILWNDSLKGGAATNERHNGKYLRFEDFWQVVHPSAENGLPRDAKSFDVGELNVKVFRTNHFPEQAQSWETAAYSVGILIDNRILFSGDTKFDASLVADFDKHYDIEWIFHDTQFRTGGVHASLEELASLPESVRSRMLLMHYPDGWQEHVEKVRSLGFHDFAREWNFYDFD